MGFFKEFKDDLSQAVNDVLPDEESEQLDNQAQDHIVNTLDTEDNNSEETSSDNEKMKELLNEFTQEEDPAKEEADTDESDDLQKDTADVTEESKEEEGENMDDNVDLELLEALDADDEADKKAESKEIAAPRKKTVSEDEDDEATVISKGTTINGSISSDGSLDIQGNVTGDIECLGKLSITGKINGNSSAAEVYVNTERMEGSITSEGSVKIGLGTVVIGDITATSGVFAGAVKGEVDINGPVVIDSTAIIKGNIKAKTVQINNGAVVEGFCSLSYSDINVDNIFE